MLQRANSSLVQRPIGLALARILPWIVASPAFFSVFICSNLARAAVANVDRTHTIKLQADSLDTPLGIDDLHPRLSWQMQTARRGAAQTAFEIKVALSPEQLKTDGVWDSGRVVSADSVDIEYRGTPLQPRTRYYWQVQTWDEHGRPTVPSKPSWWETGFLQPSEWKAQWISSDKKDDLEDRKSAPRWIWTSGEDALHHAKGGPHRFRLNFTLNEQPAGGTLLITAKDTVSASVNGIPVLMSESMPPWGPSLSWGTFRTVDVSTILRKGKNTLAVQAAAIAPTTDPRAALIALLRVRLADGRVVRYVSDAGWKSSDNAKGDWTETNYDDAAWSPTQIVAQLGENPLGTPWPSKPASIFRRDLSFLRTIRRARLYITALGAYEAYINGRVVGHEVLAPGWTDYKSRLYYQTYDVTTMLHKGKNVVGVLLGDGWYGSGLITYQQRFNFGPPPLRLIAQLDVEYTDGTHEQIGTDGSWKTASSGVLRSDLYNGEQLDARNDQPGWDRAGFHEGVRWENAVLAEVPPAHVVAQDFQPIEVERSVKPTIMTSPSPGVYVFDLGQNLVGTERMRVNGPRGTVVRLRFGEVLRPDGTLYTENTRTAEATDTYTLRGGGEEMFVPHFTYHGYRYIEVRGYPGTPRLDAVTAIVFHTGAPFNMSFRTASPAVNQLWSNILWGQRGNFQSIPTDCPQRDERLGWMGDAQVFWRTASYNMNLAAFSEKFDKDMRDAQSEQGNFSDITPRVGTVVGDGSPGWADAGVIIPYIAWKQYGDLHLVQSAWNSMNRYLALLLQQNPDYINHRQAYGDWLAIGSTTPQDLIATAYWAHDAKLMTEMAIAIGRPDEARRYAELLTQIRMAFQRQFLGPDGSVGSNSQTSYVLALQMELIPEAQRGRVAERLVTDLQIHQWHLTTGFLGTPYTMSVLSNTGHSDVAYRLLMQDTFPSWGYMVKHGATTMWERWNGDQMLDDPGMNSFNHYAYGAVGEWMYRYVAGIDLGPKDIGFQHFELHPQFNRSLGKAKATYQSTYGAIRSDWIYGEKDLEWTATIPPNTSATIYLPANLKVLLNGGPLSHSSAGISSLTQTSEAISAELKAGTYRFTVSERPQSTSVHSL